MNRGDNTVAFDTKITVSFSCLMVDFEFTLDAQNILDDYSNSASVPIERHEVLRRNPKNEMASSVGIRRMEPGESGTLGNTGFNHFGCWYADVFRVDSMTVLVS